MQARIQVDIRQVLPCNPEGALSEEPRLKQTASCPAKEALLVATACSSPPEGRARWTLELLAGCNGQAHRARRHLNSRDFAHAVKRRSRTAWAKAHNGSCRQPGSAQ